MKRNNNQSTERKWKRSLIYTQCGKRIEEELTYDRFEKELIAGFLEFCFKFKDSTIDIAFHHDGKKKVYELNINGYDEDARHYEFNSAEELLEKGRINGKPIKEIWNELET